MELKIIKTKKDYHESLARFEEIFAAKHGSKEGNEADVLALLISACKKTPSASLFLS